MRYVIVGAGAVGATIGGRLFEAGLEVLLVARGPHGEALARDGLRLSDPDRSVVLPVPAVVDVEAVGWRDDDIVVIAAKSQDTAGILDRLAACAPPAIALVCAQNGVANEQAALRRIADVYGMCVMLPAQHLAPGVVLAYSSPTPGILDVGRYPSGLDDGAAQIAGDLRRAGFESVARPDIMRWKHGKLLMNLGSAIEAACGPDGRGGELWHRARREAIACFEAAGIAYAGEAEDRERRGDHMTMRPIGGQRRGGGSSWQSLARGTGAIEVDYLNGEVVLIGRLHGVPTPVNEMLQRAANELARAGAPPGSLSVAELEARL